MRRYFYTILGLLIVVVTLLAGYYANSMLPFALYGYYSLLHDEKVVLKNINIVLPEKWFIVKKDKNSQEYVISRLPSSIFQKNFTPNFIVIKSIDVLNSKQVRSFIPRNEHLGEFFCDYDDSNNVGKCIFEDKKNKTYFIYCKGCSEKLFFMFVNSIKVERASIAP